MGSGMKFAWLRSHESYLPELLVEQAVLAKSAGFNMVLARIGADYVSVQVASADPMRTIALIGDKVLPGLRAEVDLGAGLDRNRHRRNVH